MAAFYVMAVLFSAVGAGFILYVLRRRRIAAASRHWPAVQGRVLRTAIRDQSDVEIGSKFRPVVAYAYRAADRSFTSERIHFGNAYVRSHAEAEAVIARYPPGSVVTVLVDPERPAVAVLEPVAPGLGLWITLGTTIIAAVSAVGALILFTS